MARSTRSAATERAYLKFALPPQRGEVGGGGVPGEEFDESDIWGAFCPAPAESRVGAHRSVPAGRKAKQAPLVAGSRAAAAHGSLPVNIPDWSKILGDEYRGHAAAAGEWELDDGDEDDFVDGAVVPPHELAWRRRAASLSVHEGAGVVGRTLKVRDAVWKRTTGFQD